MKGVWFGDVVDVPRVSDGEVPKVFVFWVDLVVDVDLVLAPKVVVCKVVPMDLSLNF